MPERALTVAVTGASGIFGRSLCARLDEDPDVDRLVGLARRPFDAKAHGLEKLEFRQTDVLDPSGLDEAFAGVDVVCHLAFTILDRGAPLEEVRRVNVEGSANVFEAAVRARARRVVYASSIAAYGAHADNPVPIPEDHPTRGQPGVYYAEHKAAVERMLGRVATRVPSLEIVRLRPCVVVGPRSADLFRGPLPSAVVGLALSPLSPWLLPDPGMAPMQFVHEDDVAEAFRLALTAALPSTDRAYNLAGGGTMTGDDLARALGALRVPAPPGLLGRVVDVAHWLRLAPGGSPWLEMLRHPVVVDTQRARRELGWSPRFDTRTALEDMLDHYRAAVPSLNRRGARSTAS